MRQAINMRLPTDLLARVDVARGDVSRTRWVERALEAALGESPEPVHPSSRALPVDPALKEPASPRAPGTPTPVSAALKPASEYVKPSPKYLKPFRPMPKKGA